MQELFEQFTGQLADAVASAVLSKVRAEIGTAVAADFEFGWLERDLAEKLGCDVQTLARARKAGEIDHSLNPAGRVFYMPHHVYDYLMRRETRNGKSEVTLADVIHFQTRKAA